MIKKRLVSKNRSTQLVRQEASAEENLLDGVEVMHLKIGLDRKHGRKRALILLVPAHGREVVDCGMELCICLFPSQEGI